jgi:hypothetical protein
MAVALLPLARSLPLLVERRETTTLLTVDGTLLHRDRLTLRQPGGLGAALDVILPATAKLWSAKVNELPVRPLERGNGTISIPLGFETGKEPVIEIVSVLEKAMPSGRSELALTLPQIAVPVQVHEWRVLLPDGPKYRFRSGELRPAAVPIPKQSAAGRDPWSVLQSTPGVLTDRINVGGNEAGQQSAYSRPDSPLVDQRRVSSGATVTNTDLERIPTSRDPLNKDMAAAAEEKKAKALFAKEAQGLQQGLVGGVKPLPIAIPESGEVLFLTGVLPPAKVGVELEVKGKR